MSVRLMSRLLAAHALETLYQVEQGEQPPSFEHDQPPSLRSVCQHLFEMDTLSDAPEARGLSTELCEEHADPCDGEDYPVCDEDYPVSALQDELNDPFISSWPDCETEQVKFSDTSLLQCLSDCESELLKSTDDRFPQQLSDRVSPTPRVFSEYICPKCQRPLKSSPSLFGGCSGKCHLDEVRQPDVIVFHGDRPNDLHRPSKRKRKSGHVHRPSQQNRRQTSDTLYILQPGEALQNKSPVMTTQQDVIPEHDYCLTDKQPRCQKAEGIAKSPCSSGAKPERTAKRPCNSGAGRKRKRQSSDEEISTKETLRRRTKAEREKLRRDKSKQVFDIAEKVLKQTCPTLPQNKKLTKKLILTNTYAHLKSRVGTSVLECRAIGKYSKWNSFDLQEFLPAGLQFPEKDVHIFDEDDI